MSVTMFITTTTTTTSQGMRIIKRNVSDENLGNSISQTHWIMCLSTMDLICHQDLIISTGTFTPIPIAKLC